MTDSNAADDPGDIDSPSVPRTDIHLPRRRHASPWSNRWLLVFAVVIALLLAPLWIDPTLFAELIGSPATPSPSASPRVLQVEQPSPSLTSAAAPPTHLWGMG